MLSREADRGPRHRPPTGDIDGSRIVVEEVLRNSASFGGKGESRKVDVGYTLGYWASESKDKAKSILHEFLEVIVV